MTLEEAIKTANKGGNLYRVSKPYVTYPLPGFIPIRLRVPAEDQYENDWVVWDFYKDYR